MEDSIFANDICDGCNKPVIIGEDYLYDISIYKYKLLYANNRKELDVLSATMYHQLCKFCVSEPRAKTLLFSKNKNIKSKDGRKIAIPTCNSCGKLMDDSGDIFWSICLTKCDIKKSVNAVHPEDAYDMIHYCEECGNNRDLYQDLSFCESYILTKEAFSELSPPKGTFIPSQIDFCKVCGSPVE